MRCTAMATVVSMVAMTPAVGAEDVRLLAGFEKEQMITWGAKADGDRLLWGRTTWIEKGDATEGEWAIAVTRGQYLRPGAHYSALRRNGVLLRTYGWFRKRFPGDWSAYNRLRVDLKGDDAGGRVRLEVEDEICMPLVRAVYRFPKGKWVTLEFDLAEASKLHTLPPPPDRAGRPGTDAVKGRVLNLKRMANIYLYLEQLDAPSTVRVDNLRLLAKGAAERTGLPVLTNIEPFLKPAPLPPSTPTPRAPTAEAKAPSASGGAPVIRSVDLSKARKTGYGRLSGITRRAVVAVDRRRMLLGFLAGYVHVLKTADGGRTWAGLDGTPTPTRCYHNANAPSHAAVAAGPDLLYSYTDHCSGGSSPSNMFFRLLKHDGTTWRLGPPRLLDVDCRHCPEWHVRGIRLSSGRIWWAWKHLDRFGKVWVRARYSDDEGVTWRDPDSNAMLTINQDNSQGPQRTGITLWAEPPLPAVAVERANGRLGVMAHNNSNLVLTPYGDHVACLWCRGWHPDMVWAWFNGTKWTEPLRFPKPFEMGRPVSAVTLGERTIYLSYGYRKTGRVIRWDGKTWVEDTPPGGKAGLLSASGDTVFCLWTDRKETAATIYVSRKQHGGTWSSPEALAKEALPGAGGGSGLTLAAPQYAPRAFVPVAFGPQRERIKVMQLPNRAR